MYKRQDLDRPDSETLHGIFRAAHSIKGSSGMFGFDDITAVTHELETLLDRIRCGQMHLRPDMISSFLEARDVLQRLLDAHRSGSPDPGVPLLETVERLRGWLRVPEQEAAEEGFGLFDDAPARETADDDAFGFFDEGPGAPERAAAPEAFGLFDEAPGAPAASEAFGLSLIHISTNTSAWSACTASSEPTRTSCPAAWPSAWRSPVAWWPARACCCSTSRSAPSTH